LKFLWGAADFVTKQSEIVNNSMQLGPSWEADSHLTIQESPNIVCNPTLHRRHLLVSILS
jgi:hypothetical protein